LLAHGRWFSPGTPASSITKAGRHVIAKILLKVALNTINQSMFMYVRSDMFHCSVFHQTKLLQYNIEFCFHILDTFLTGWFNYTKEMTKAVQDKSVNIIQVLYEDLLLVNSNSCSFQI
jgi:hypothetical protein